jgi:hypothetical protein
MKDEKNENEKKKGERAEEKKNVFAYFHAVFFSSAFLINF